MEADLRRFFHVSRRELDLAETAALLRFLPLEAELMDNDGWSHTDQLISDLIFVQSGTHHPADPRVLREKEQKRAVLAERGRRSAERRRRLGITGSVLQRKEAG